QTNRPVAACTANTIPEPSSPRAQLRTRRLSCESCGTPIEHRTGRRPRFCSDRCRMREYGQRRVRKRFLERHTGAATKRQKNDSKSHALQRAKFQSSTRIIGPRRVLDIELWDRAWRRRVSDDGVPVMVSRFAPAMSGDSVQPESGATNT